MSDPLRIALVAEGPTDAIVIESALNGILEKRDFVLKLLQPEDSKAFGVLGGGWTGVYRWCEQAAERGGGRLANDALLFSNYDLLILHLDADVADKTYASGRLHPKRGDGSLPCARPCPPPSDTTNTLRSVLLSWCKETATPPKTVICMPSKSTEAWIVATLFPEDRSMRTSIECYANPEARLGQQPNRQRIRKTTRDYRKQAERLTRAWPRIAQPRALGEAHRFQVEFLAALPTEK